MEATLVPYDFPIPQCAIYWNTLHCRPHADKPSVRLIHRCRVSDSVRLLTNLLVHHNTSCTILYLVAQYISIITNIMLSVIIIVRLYAMYQRSRQMLIFLVVTFLAIKITSGVIATIGTTMHISGKEHVLSGAHICLYAAQGDGIFLLEMNWILGTAWEIIVLCLAVWIAVKHFHELQRPSTGWTVGDCFTILVKTHVFYFASFITVSTLELTDYFSPKLEDSTSVAYGVFAGILNVTQVVQMYILGPRLVLGVREYHANLVANSDEGLGMISIVFKERVHISTSSDV